MSGVLIRLGGLIIVLDLIYLAVGEIVDEVVVHDAWFRAALLAGAVCIAGGIVLWLVGRATASAVGRTCPRCRRRVAHGRIYCDEHRSEAINQYRDHERKSGR
jgi:hypothetical protein